jgi:ABC-type multidrug transport system fused ATPase/permease subunit
MGGYSKKHAPQARPTARLRSLLRSFVTPRDADGESLVAAAPALTVRELFSAFWPYARPYRRWIPLGLGLIAIGALAVTVEIWLFKLVVDQVVVPGDLGPLLWIGLAYLGLTVITGLASFGDDYVATWIGERFLLDLRTDLLAHLQRLSPDFLERHRLGDLLARLDGDVAAIERFILAGLADALSALLRITFFACALFILDWQMALVALVVGPAFFLIARWLVRLIKRASREKRRRSGSLGAVAEQTLANQMLVRSSNREAAELRRFRREGEGALQAELASARIHGLFTPLVEVVELAGAMLVITLGTLAVADGSLTLGGLLVFVTYLGKLYGPVRDLSAVGESMFAAAAGAERVIELMRERPSVVDRPGARRIGTARGEVELAGVSFAYPGAAEPALRDVDLRVAPGETVAVVGPSGAGKSTLAKLLLRFHDPQRGSVRLDGTDLREIELASLRRNVSILLQEAPVLHGTVRENIAYGTPGARDAEILAAAEAVGARGLIEALPQGLDTQLGERGRRLSGGQRQRIAMARAVLRAAPVLILDEPGTGLDGDSRDALLDPLRRLTRDATAIVITHDPRFAEGADRIVTIEDGALVSVDSADPAHEAVLRA